MKNKNLKTMSILALDLLVVFIISNLSAYYVPFMQALLLPYESILRVFPLFAGDYVNMSVDVPIIFLSIIFSLLVINFMNFIFFKTTNEKYDVINNNKKLFIITIVSNLTFLTLLFLLFKKIEFVFFPFLYQMYVGSVGFLPSYYRTVLPVILTLISSPALFLMLNNFIKKLLNKLESRRRRIGEV